jgi:hypothetical protein
VAQLCRSRSGDGQQECAENRRFTGGAENGPLVAPRFEFARQVRSLITLSHDERSSAERTGIPFERERVRGVENDLRTPFAPLIASIRGSFW